MLELSSYRLTFRGKPTARLPEWLGSTWRGAMGHVLKERACHCANGTHSIDCVYSQIFETPIPPDSTRLRKYTAAPHPYILRPQLRSVEDPGVLKLDLVLLGKARVHSRPVRQALVMAAERGLGSARSEFKLVTDNCQQLKTNLIGNTTHVEVQLQTPHVVKYKGKIMTPKSFDLSGWLINIMRRSNSLRYFHGDGYEPNDAEVKTMLHAIAKIRLLDQNLFSHHIKRHSSRQQKKILLPGFMGHFEIDLRDVADTLLPLLNGATHTHVGKSTVMGHGQFTLRDIV